MMWWIGDGSIDGFVSSVDSTVLIGATIVTPKVFFCQSTDGAVLTCASNLVALRNVNNECIVLMCYWMPWVGQLLHR